MTSTIEISPFKSIAEHIFTFLDSFPSNMFSENIFRKYHEHHQTCPPQRIVMNGKIISPYPWQTKRNFCRSNKLIEQTAVDRACKFDQKKTLHVAIFMIK